MFNRGAVQNQPHKINNPMTAKEVKIREQLALCRGSRKSYFQELFKPLTYSEGIKEMYTLCDAHWLLAACLSNLATMKNQHEFIVMKLYRKEGATSCYLSYEDGNGTQIKRVDYYYTTFPLSDREHDNLRLPAITLYFQNDMLYLPSEN